MISSAFTRTVSGNTILFANSTPLENVGKIRFYKDNASATGWVRKELRWSFNRSYWSSWMLLNQENLVSILVGNNKFIFLEIRYISSGSGTCTSFSLDYTSSTSSSTSVVSSIDTLVSANNFIPDEHKTSTPRLGKSGNIFSDFHHIITGNTILFSNYRPINNVGKITFYKDNASGTFIKEEFRWSFNRTYWSSWTALNQENLILVSTGNNKYLFLEIRYTFSGTASCSSFSITYTLNSSPTYAPPIEGVEMEHDHTFSDGCGGLGGTIKTYNVTEITNAETLCGKGCDYYLWRPNHMGEQPISSITNLQEILDDFSKTIQDVAITDASTVAGPGVGVYFNKVDKKIYFKTLIAGNKLFIREDLLGHITLDVDDASINELFTSLGNLDGVNIGGGAGEIFKQRLGDHFQFRTIAGATDGVHIETIGDQVLIGLDASITGESVWYDVNPVSANVGGIDSGNDVSVGANSIEILERILYQYFPPNISLSLNPSLGYYQKYLAIPDISVYGSFNNDSFTKIRISDVSSYKTLAGIDFGIGHQSYPPDTGQGTFSFNDNISNSSWNDAVYKVKIYNYNRDTSIMMPVAEASTSLQFVNPYTWGVIDTTITDVNIGNITSNIIEGLLNDPSSKLIVPKQDNKINFIKDPSMGYKLKFVYAYDASYGELNSIFDSGNNFNVTTSFDTKILDLSIGAPTLIPYRIYIKSHWIDVSSFKLIFNI